MTNAEKFLKDGVSEELIADLANYIRIHNTGTRSYLGILHTYFDKPINPTLTEDERIILRNMQKKKYIYRDEYGRLYVYHNKGRKDYQVMEYLQIEMYNHLFQFIKARRRILY